MRTFIVLVTLCVAAAGCATTTADSADQGIVLRDDLNEALVREIYAAFGRGDAPAVLAAFDPQIRWNEAENFAYADRNPYIGPQAVAEGIFGRIMSEWGDFAVKPQEFISEGDHVVVIGRYQGVFKATGRPVDAQFVHVWTVNNGKATSFQQYTDTAQFRSVMAVTH